MTSALANVCGLVANACFLLRDPNFISKPSAVYFSYLLAGFLAGFAVRGIVLVVLAGPRWFRALPSVEKDFYREWFGQWLFAAVCISTWIAAHWPGVFNWDTYGMYTSITLGAVHEWSSSLYSLFLLTMLQFSNNPAVSTIVQATAITAAASWLTSTAIRLGLNRWAARALLALFFLTPMNAAMTISLNRDIVFSWLHFFTAILFPWYVMTYKSGEAPSRATIIAFAAVAVFAARIRMEAVVVLPLLPILFSSVCRWTHRRIALYVCATGVLLAVLFIAVPKWTQTIPSGAAYKLTGILNPLGYLVHHGYRTLTPEADKRAIDEVVDYEGLRTFNNPYIAYAGFRPGISDADWQRVSQVYWLAVFSNLDHFFRNRWLVFLATAGFTPQHTWYISNSFGDNYQFARDTQRAVGFKKYPLVPWFANQPYWSLLIGTKDYPLRILSETLLVPICILLVSLLLSPWTPGCGAAAAVIGFRLLIVFLTAPHTQFKYLYGVYIFGFFAPLFLWLEFRTRVSQPC